MKQPSRLNDGAAAMRDGRTPRPADAPLHMRNVGPDAMKGRPAHWDAIDEARDESFAASDSSAKY